MVIIGGLIGGLYAVGEGVPTCRVINGRGSLSSTNTEKYHNGDLSNEMMRI